MLPEVLGQVDADDVLLFLCQPLNDVPNVVGAAVVHQHDLGTVAGNYIHDESIKKSNRPMVKIPFSS